MPMTKDVLLEDVVDDWIDVFINILEENRETVFDGQFELLQEIWIIESQHLQIIQYTKKVRQSLQEKPIRLGQTCKDTDTDR